MPSNHALLGPRIKVARTWQHLKAIESAIWKFFEDPVNRPGIDAVFDLSQEWQVLTWKGIEPMPPYWGALLGDFAHNGRSALDQMMWTLVAGNNGSPGVHTQFPICETEGKWQDDIVNRDPSRGPAPTDGLSDDAFDLVHVFQPFQPTAVGEHGKRLFTLLRISNEDKHRTLLASLPYSMSRPQGLRIVPEGYFAIDRIRYGHAVGRLIENDAEVARMKLRVIVEPPPETRVGVQFAQQGNVTFRAGDTRLVDATELRPILRAVRWVIRWARMLPEAA